MPQGLLVACRFFETKIPERPSKNFDEILYCYWVEINNGPGNRSVVWLQGCSRKCPGCFNLAFCENITAFQPWIRVEAHVLTAAENELERIWLQEKFAQ